MKKETLRNWGIIIAILVASGLVTAVWPLLSRGAGSSSRSAAVPIETELIDLATIPGIGTLLVENLGVEKVSSFAILGATAALVIGLVVGAGVTLAFVYMFASNFVQRSKESNEFKEGEQKLGKFLQVQSKDRKANRNPNPTPSHKMPRWSAISTSLIILMFAIFFGIMVVRTFVPNDEWIVGDRILNTATLTFWAITILTALILVWRVRPRRLEAPDNTNVSSIPWDAIVVIVTGLLVVGLGIGFAVYLNVPV